MKHNNWLLPTASSYIYRNNRPAHTHTYNTQKPDNKATRIANCAKLFTGTKKKQGVPNGLYNSLLSK